MFEVSDGFWNFAKAHRLATKAKKLNTLSRERASRHSTFWQCELYLDDGRRKASMVFALPTDPKKGVKHALKAAEAEAKKLSSKKVEVEVTTLSKQVRYDPDETLELYNVFKEYDDTIVEELDV